MHIYVHCSTIHNCQDLETFQMPTTENWEENCERSLQWNTTQIFKEIKYCIFTAICMKLKGILLSKMSQKEK